MGIQLGVKDVLPFVRSPILRFMARENAKIMGLRRWHVIKNSNAKAYQYRQTNGARVRNDITETPTPVRSKNPNERPPQYAAFGTSLPGGVKIRSVVITRHHRAQSTR